MYRIQLLFAVFILSVATGCAARTVAEVAGASPQPPPRMEATAEPQDRVWIIPGDLGTRHEISGTLSAADKSPVTLFLQVEGLPPGSPTQSSRQVVLDFSCGGAVAGWTYTPVDFALPESRSERMGCGQATTLYFSYDYNFRRIQIHLSADKLERGAYAITATIHAPY